MGREMKHIIISLLEGDGYRAVLVSENCAGPREVKRYRCASRRDLTEADANAFAVSYLNGYAERCREEGWTVSLNIKGN